MPLTDVFSTAVPAQLSLLNERQRLRHVHSLTQVSMGHKILHLSVRHMLASLTRHPSTLTLHPHSLLHHQGNQFLSVPRNANIMTLHPSLTPSG